MFTLEKATQIFPDTLSADVVPALTARFSLLSAEVMALRSLRSAFELSGASVGMSRATSSPKRSALIAAAAIGFANSGPKDGCDASSSCATRLNGIARPCEPLADAVMEGGKKSSAAYTSTSAACCHSGSM